MNTLLQDLRYALRTLRKAPMFALTSIMVLALAIGANTAMFSVVEAVLLRPLPYPQPEQLAVLWKEIPNQNVREARPAYGTVADWRRETKTFADIAFFDPLSTTLTNGENAERVSVMRASANLLPLLGIQPIAGRGFTAQEADERQGLALISESFWRTHFGGAGSAVGSTIMVDGAPSRIIGVLPPLLYPQADIWQPHTLFRDWDVRRAQRGTGSWLVLGRMKSGVRIEQAQTEMSAMAREGGVSVVPLSQQLTGPRQQLALWMLSAALLCVLLIAVSNIAGLAVARNSGRERELAIRAALGASRVRIARQLLIESLMIASLAGALGIGLAKAGIALIAAGGPAGLVRLNEVSLDGQALAWTLVLCALTGILVGAAPAMLAGRWNLAARGVSAARGIRRVLVATEFALAVTLLVGAGLLVRSLWSAQNVALGFRPEKVLSLQVSTLPGTSHAQRVDLYQRVLQQVGAVPGIESAGVIEDWFVGGGAEQLVSAEGETPQRFRLRRDGVSADLFRTLGVPLVEGRVFSSEDGPNAPRVAIVNRTLARRLWPGANALGKRFQLGDWFTVVGVVGDMRRQGLEADPIPQVFQPLAQDSSRRATILVRTRAEDPLTMAMSVEAAVHQVEKRVPVYGVTSLEARLGGFLAERRFQTSLLIGFALAALLMAAVGIFGLIQYSVAMRTQEIGIRLAIGAQAADVFRMVIGEGLRLSLAGLGAGLAAAFALGRLGTSLLFGVSAADPVTYVVVSLLLAVVAVVACYVPARRAMRIEPVVALRGD